MTTPLAGCTVVVTREERGELGRLLDERGARVVHIPLIRVVDADPDELAAAWSCEPQWLIVTSAAGAERVGAAAAARPTVRLAVVGTATAQRLAELAGRPVDLVPDRQLAEELAAAFNARHDRPQRVLVAQADRASTTLVDRLVAAGHEVTTAVAYRTELCPPDPDGVASIEAADAVIFASGSAARSWAATLGDRVDLIPPLVVAIGPTTAAVAAESGLKVTHVAADHSLVGVVDELTRAWASPG